MKTALSFDDVLLVPGYNDIGSRSNVILTTKVAGLTLDMPIIAANMPAVCEDQMAAVIGSYGGMGIIHRMQSIDYQCRQISNVIHRVGGAIGIGDDWKIRTESLLGALVSIVCLDVAHGHQEKVLDVALEFLDTFENVPLIIGNIATGHAASHFDREISDKDQHRVALKVGVGGGSVCTTRINTGFGIPTFQSIMDVKYTLMETSSEMTIIADGGLRSSGDIVKALAAGADAVMLGGLLAGTREAPGDVIKDDKTGLKYKVYRGTASYGAKQAHFGEAEYIEGAERLIPYKGPVNKTLARLIDGIKSGLTYCGVDNVLDLNTEAEFVRITEAGLKESLPHGIYQ